MEPPSGTSYFAYGSNLSLVQMAERCPFSEYRGRGILHGYRWQINQRGYANIVPSETHRVEGMVFTLSPKDEELLDLSEGVSNGIYERRILPIQLFEWKQPIKTAVVARKLRQNEPLGFHCEETEIQALVYASSTWTHDGPIKQSFLEKLLRALKDAADLGMSLSYSSSQVYPFLAGPTMDEAQSQAEPEESFASEDEAVATDLAACTITPNDAIQINQISHRLKLLSTWFGSRQHAKATLAGKTILELGCGQGDMTVTLAYTVSSEPSNATNPQGKVIGVDPAPLDYGTPFNLGEAQAALSQSKLGSRIQWIQADPVDFLKSKQGQEIDYIVFAHSLFYLPSAEYFSNLLRVLRGAASPLTKLLLADWGMEYSAPEAEAHVLAVKVQLECPTFDANIRTVIDPEKMMSMIRQAGWRLERQEWIREPQVDDGKWEVGNARKRLAAKDMTDKGKEYFAALEKVVEKNGGVVKSMDVWTCVCRTHSIET